jgi:predicted DNA-binding transcriptional regulator AlpA
MASAEKTTTTRAAWLRFSELRREVVPVHRVTLYRWVKAGTFPAPHRIGHTRTLFWSRAEVDAWAARQHGVAAL